MCGAINMRVFLIMTEVFSSTECVVCLNGNDDADDESVVVALHVIFVPCMHRCCCDDCCAKIQDAGLACPLCRAVITAHRVYAFPDLDMVQAVDSALVEDFKRERRHEYREQMRRTVKSNAAYVGKSKLARSVASAVGSELEQRERETRGTERVMAKPSTVATARIDDGDTLAVDYKCGRSKRHESHPYAEWDEVARELLAALGGDRISVVDLATHYPEFYWLIYHHRAGRVAAAMEELGIAESNKQRKR